MDKVSVIVPIYNVEEHLHKGIDCIINQTYSSLEIILVDDGSPDNCGKICDEYAAKDLRIKVIHKKNGGVSSARNVGIDVATGKWIYFMDPDDWIELNLLEKAINKAKETNADLCIWDVECVAKYKKRLSAIKGSRTFFDDIDNLDTMILFNCGPGIITNFVVKSVILKDKLKFDESLSYREDEVFKLELFQHIKSFCYLPEVLYYYRVHENSACNMTALSCIEKNKEAYHCSTKIISVGLYPQNAQIVANSKYLESYSSTVDRVLASNICFSQKEKLYYELINSFEFQNAVKNYNDIYYGSFAKLCLKNKMPFIAVVFLRKIVNIVKKLKK